MARTIASSPPPFRFEAKPLRLSAPTPGWAARLTDAACLLAAFLLAGALSGAIMGSAMLVGGGPRMEGRILGQAGAPLPRADASPSAQIAPGSP